jgi:hypothetical protein
LEHKPYVVAFRNTPGGASAGSRNSLITSCYGVLATHRRPEGRHPLRA